MVMKTIHRLIAYEPEPEEKARGHRVHYTETRQLFPAIDHYLFKKHLHIKVYPEASTFKIEMSEIFYDSS